MRSLRKFHRRSSYDHRKDGNDDIEGTTPDQENYATEGDIVNFDTVKTHTGNHMQRRLSHPTDSKQHSFILPFSNTFTDGSPPASETLSGQTSHKLSSTKSMFSTKLFKRDVSPTTSSDTVYTSVSPNQNPASPSKPSKKTFINSIHPVFKGAFNLSLGLGSSRRGGDSNSQNSNVTNTTTTTTITSTTSTTTTTKSRREKEEEGRDHSNNNNNNNNNNQSFGHVPRSPRSLNSFTPGIDSKIQSQGRVSLDNEQLDDDYIIPTNAIAKSPSRAKAIQGRDHSPESMLSRTSPKAFDYSQQMFNRQSRGFNVLTRPQSNLNEGVKQKNRQVRILSSKDLLALQSGYGNDTVRNSEEREQSPTLGANSPLLMGNTKTGDNTNNAINFDTKRHSTSSKSRFLMDNIRDSSNGSGNSNEMEDTARDYTRGTWECKDQSEQSVAFSFSVDDSRDLGSNSDSNMVSGDGSAPGTKPGLMVSLGSNPRAGFDSDTNSGSKSDSDSDSDSESEPESDSSKFSFEYAKINGRTLSMKYYPKEEDQAASESAAKKERIYIDDLYEDDDFGDDMNYYDEDDDDEMGEGAAGKYLGEGNFKYGDVAADRSGISKYSDLFDLSDEDGSEASSIGKIKPVGKVGGQSERADNNGPNGSRQPNNEGEVGGVGRKQPLNGDEVIEARDTQTRLLAPMRVTPNTGKIKKKISKYNDLFELSEGADDDDMETNLYDTENGSEFPQTPTGNLGGMPAVSGLGNSKEHNPTYTYTTAGGSGYHSLKYNSGTESSVTEGMTTATGDSSNRPGQAQKKKVLKYNDLFDLSDDNGDESEGKVEGEGNLAEQYPEEEDEELLAAVSNELDDESASSSNYGYKSTTAAVTSGGLSPYPLPYSAMGSDQFNSYRNILLESDMSPSDAESRGSMMTPPGQKFGNLYFSPLQAKSQPKSPYRSPYWGKTPQLYPPDLSTRIPQLSPLITPHAPLVSSPLSDRHNHSVYSPLPPPARSQALKYHELNSELDAEIPKLTSNLYFIDEAEEEEYNEQANETTEKNESLLSGNGEPKKIEDYLDEINEVPEDFVFSDGDDYRSDDRVRRKNSYDKYVSKWRNSPKYRTSYRMTHSYSSKPLGVTKENKPMNNKLELENKTVTFFSHDWVEPSLSRGGSRSGTPVSDSDLTRESSPHVSYTGNTGSDENLSLSPIQESTSSLSGSPVKK